MTTDLEHLDRVSRGEFPADTRARLQDLINGCLRGRFRLNVTELGYWQRNQAIRKLWEITPADSESGKACAILRGFRRFSGRVVAGRPETRLYAALSQLHTAGYKMPASTKQLTRIYKNGTGDSTFRG